MAGRPNILWLMTDEQRADSLGAGGALWASTPNLDRLANGGTRFDSAYSPSPICVPARAIMLTGRAGSSIGVTSNHHWLDAEDPGFLSWLLARNGYQIASVGKHHYLCPRRAFDAECGVTIGEHVSCTEYLVDVDEEEAGVVRYEAGTVYNWLLGGRYPGSADETPEMFNVNEALSWLQRRDPQRPFFLRVSLNAPHTPVVPPAPFDTLIDPGAIDLPVDYPDTMKETPTVMRDYYHVHAGTGRMNERQIARSRQCYYGMVAFLDHCLGKLIDVLRDSGELDNTIVAFVSDHGAHLGDHGFYQKQSYYEASVRVPLFFCGPGVATGKVVSIPVSAGSLMPTLLDLAGIEIPAQVEYPSLAETLRTGAEPTARPVFSELDFGIWGYRDGDRYVMVRDGDWKLAVFRDPLRPERFADTDGLVLFNLAEDPGERHNRSDDPVCAETVARLIALIDAWDDGRVARESARRRQLPAEHPLHWPGPPEAAD